MIINKGIMLFQLFNPNIKALITKLLNEINVIHDFRGSNFKLI